MSHTVTITRLPDEESDDYGYEFGGTHGADCATLRRCKRQACQAMNPEYDPGDERVRHGKDHYYRDGDWLVESDTCALAYVFENATDAEYFGGLPLGTYPIRVEWEDDSWWFEIQPSADVEIRSER
jgi:hypothetical protein